MENSGQFILFVWTVPIWMESPWGPNFISVDNPWGSNLGENYNYGCKKLLSCLTPLCTVQS